MMRVRPTVSANFAGSARKPGARTSSSHGVGELADEHEEEQRREQDRHRVLGEALGVRLAVMRDHAGEQRHEGGGERALGEEAAEQVGQALRDEEGVGHGPGTEECRGQDIADEAEDPARHGVAADRRDRAQQSHEPDGVVEARESGKSRPCFRSFACEGRQSELDGKGGPVQGPAAAS